MLPLYWTVLTVHYMLLLMLSLLNSKRLYYTLCKGYFAIYLVEQRRDYVCIRVIARCPAEMKRRVIEM